MACQDDPADALGGEDSGGPPGLDSRVRFLFGRVELLLVVILLAVGVSVGVAGAEAVCARRAAPVRAVARVLGTRIWT